MSKQTKPSQPQKELPYLSVSGSSSTESFHGSSHGTSNTNTSASSTKSNDEIRRLPTVLTACVKSGMTACEIGQYLHRAVACSDNPVTGLIADLINSNTPYSEIGMHVLCALDLKNEKGCALHVAVDAGDRGLVPDTSKIVHSNRNDTGGPTLTAAPQAIRPQLIPWLFQDEEELEAEFGVGFRLGRLDEDSSDDDFETYVARVVHVSRHIAQVVEASSPPRSLRGDVSS
ncbi:uncharacterized protein BJX67DRAFT_228273 [Aspergillus lucknowensis]|uniref:Uncharacterized protein n=1 Tax=Aspergillus lucknowensis TaxID=176173 RepID=A0ABR4LI50_9EURO